MSDKSAGQSSAITKKVLIVYGSRCGSTAEIAERIGQVFRNAGTIADVVNAKKAGDIKGYCLVVVGSAIRMGKWLPETLTFIEKNRAGLSTIPCAVFSVHTNNIDNSDTAREQRSHYLDAVHKQIKPVSEEFFKGVINLAKMSFFERIMTKAVKAPAGDFREWDSILEWAKRVSQGI